MNALDWCRQGSFLGSPGLGRIQILSKPLYYMLSHLADAVIESNLQWTRLQAYIPQSNVGLHPLAMGASAMDEGAGTGIEPAILQFWPYLFWWWRPNQFSLFLSIQP